MSTHHSPGRASRASLIAFWVGMVFVAAPALAQDPALGRRDSGGDLLDALADLHRTPLDEIARLPDAGEDGSELGPVDDAAYGEQAVLLRIPEWEPWSLGVSTGIEYQNNAALSPVTKIGDYVFRGSISGRGTFALSDALFLSAGAQGQAYRYDKLDLLDYDRVDVDASLLWVLPAELPVVGGSILSLGPSYYRMSEAWEFGVGLFDNTGATAALLRDLPLGRNHNLVLSASADVSLAASDEEPRRNEYAAIAALQSRWGPRWESNVVLGTTFYDYRGHDDWNFIVAAGIDYVPRDGLRIGVSTNFTYNDSDVDVFDYENFGVGLTARATIQF